MDCKSQGELHCWLCFSSPLLQAIGASCTFNKQCSSCASPLFGTYYLAIWRIYCEHSIFDNAAHSCDALAATKEFYSEPYCVKCTIREKKKVRCRQVHRFPCSSFCARFRFLAL